MRENQRIFVFLMTFFTVIALGSLLFLSQTGSAFNRTNKSLGAETAVLKQSIINKHETVTEEVAPEPAAEPPVVEDTMASIAEASVEPEPEVVQEPEPEPEPEPQIRYFSYKVDTTVTILRLRESPSEFSEVIAKLAKGSTGYVLQPGNQWCRVVSSKGNTGYCSTDYLILTEMTKEEFPEKYREAVDVPEDSLSAPFESHITNSDTFVAGEATEESSQESTEASEGAGTETESSQISTEPDNG